MNCKTRVFRLSSAWWKNYSWAPTRGAQLSAGYTVNTYSKPRPSRLRRSLVFIARINTDRHQTRLTTCQTHSTQLKAGNDTTFVRSDTIPECDGRTNKQTDGRTSLLWLYQRLHSLLCYRAGKKIKPWTHRADLHVSLVWRRYCR